MPCPYESLSDATATPRAGWLQTENVEDVVGGDGDALVAVKSERDGIGMDAAAGLKLPKRRSGRGIQREEAAFIFAAEDQSASGGEDAGSGW